jgi:hypothetical protein
MKKCEFFVCPHVKQCSGAMRHFIHDKLQPLGLALKRLTNNPTIRKYPYYYNDEIKTKVLIRKFTTDYSPYL